MLYYLIFCLFVAIFKTIYYIKIEENEKLSNVTGKPLLGVVIISMTISFILAPLVMIELIIDLTKRIK